MLSNYGSFLQIKKLSEAYILIKLILFLKRQLFSSLTSLLNQLYYLIFPNSQRAFEEFSGLFHHSTTYCLKIAIFGSVEETSGQVLTPLSVHLFSA